MFIYINVGKLYTLSLKQNQFKINIGQNVAFKDIKVFRCKR